MTLHLGALVAWSPPTTAALAWVGAAHPLAIVVPMFAFMAAYMCTFPQGTAGALAPSPEIAGSASARSG